MSAAVCQHMGMFYLVVVRRLVFALALLGIVVGPVSVSMAAAAMAGISDMQKASMPDMASGDVMPCCPDEQPAPQNTCGNACPLALLCSPTMSAHKDSSDGWRIDLMLLGVSHDLLQEDHLPSALVEPPARPPKA